MKLTISLATVFCITLAGILLLGVPAVSAQEASLGELDQLVFNSVVPCRIVDTRNRGGLFSEDESRGYVVYGASMSNQGGNADGCPLPAGIGEPRAVHINVTALGDVGSGNFAVVRHGSPASIGPFRSTCVMVPVGRPR